MFIFRSRGYNISCVFPATSTAIGFQVESDESAYQTEPGKGENVMSVSDERNSDEPSVSGEASSAEDDQFMVATPHCETTPSNAPEELTTAPTPSATFSHQPIISLATAPASLVASSAVRSHAMPPSSGATSFFFQSPDSVSSHTSSVTIATPITTPSHHQPSSSSPSATSVVQSMRSLSSNYLSWGGATPTSSRPELRRSIRGSRKGQGLRMGATPFVTVPPPVLPFLDSPGRSVSATPPTASAPRPGMRGGSVRRRPVGIGRGLSRGRLASQPSRPSRVESREIAFQPHPPSATRPDC